LKLAYLDTNIFLTFLRSSDVNYKIVSTLIDQNRIKFITGYISLIELYSVLSREFDLLKKGLLELSTEFSLTELISLEKKMQIDIIINFLTKRFQTEIIGNQKPENHTIVGERIKLDPLNKLTIIQAPQTMLRALDNMHFAIARYIDEFLDKKIHYLVTLDRNFLKHKDNCQQNSEILILNPQTLFQLELE
jgi:predicted nucleic acid-binding protein